ncbi:F-box/WD-40 repeat-containing protein [Ophiocordyceps camponoti-floridani]|uniref:F-box/WD-40 repeat-containing protein n=1 Tax=Ophiocordyceps camponoti-floridani TaxID=2030778 RepID=A0A8H4VG60_9HYPO|nr:F-box/WD-40 repeat-containing protein [Ophiocordyceps camponoti-floridani]
MNPFSPTHHADEGYSEDPLNPILPQNLPVPAPSSLADLPAWLASNASALPIAARTELTIALLDQLPTSAIAGIVQRLNPRLYIDFIHFLPPEICLKVFGYLDPVSLVSVLLTSRAWHHLALDSKLWEKLYYLEGWKSVQSEIDSCEAELSTKLRSSLGHFHRPHGIQSKDEDLEMMDDDRTLPSIDQALAPTESIFGAPGSALSPIHPSISSLGDIDMSNSLSGKDQGVDRGYGSLDQVVCRAKRKEPGGWPEPSPPLFSRVDESVSSRMHSTLWTWDPRNGRFRINWKHLYNMRLRLESNWELGKYTTFQLPHPLHPEEGHQEGIYTLQFDANYLVSGSRDQTMRIWNIHTHRLVRAPLTGHRGSVLCLQFDADPAEDLLVSGSSDSDIFIWKFSTGELIQKITDAHYESVLNVRFDKRILVTSSKDKTIKIFNRRPLRFGELGYDSPNRGSRVDPVGMSVKRYGVDVDLAQELPVLEPYTMIRRLEGHGAAVNAIQVRDLTVVSVSGDRHIKVWNWPDQVCTKTIPAHDKGIACVEFDERRIVSGSSDFEVCVFDAPTGLKVAQLRGHAHLVRTVQAGFGDLPYSKDEDEAEAKAVDDEYFRAVNAGEVTQENGRSRRSRRVNAGSSRPDEIQAYGAKVPPGGGGGKRYGRIVSGSYDQSIIIWRRDKEGVWKPAHHLRQEEAASAAQRRMTAPPDSSDGTAHGSARPDDHPSSNETGRSLGGVGQLSSPRRRDVAPGLRGTSSDPANFPGLYMALVDQVVPLGPAALGRALENYPAMLASGSYLHTYLQGAIGREPSPFVRTQLRQIVATSLAAVHNGQLPRQRPGASDGGRQHGSRDAASRPAVAGPATAEPSQTVPSPIGLTARGTVPASLPAPVPAPAQLAATTHEQGNAQPAAHHPHIAAAENAPARVFKLQFDARKIVCCSQAPVIVGWDFCNGETELEEAARFFATVD